MAESPKDVILAVDPGRDKCGLALVTRDGETLFKEVVPRSDIADRVAEVLARGGVGPLVIGDRTGSKGFLADLRALGIPSVEHPVVKVDEHLSSQEARFRYLKDHPGRGLSRLLPATLRSPGEPIDDYVAVILAERYLRTIDGEKR